MVASLLSIESLDKCLSWCSIGNGANWKQRIWNSNANHHNTYQDRVLQRWLATLIFFETEGPVQFNSYIQKWGSCASPLGAILRLSWGHLKAILGPSWGQWGGVHSYIQKWGSCASPLGAILRLSWGHREAILGAMGGVAQLHSKMG